MSPEGVLDQTSKSLRILGQHLKSENRNVLISMAFAVFRELSGGDLFIKSLTGLARPRKKRLSDRVPGEGPRYSGSALSSKASPAKRSIH